MKKYYAHAYNSQTLRSVNQKFRGKKEENIMLQVFQRLELTKQSGLQCV